MPEGRRRFTISEPNEVPTDVACEASVGYAGPLGEGVRDGVRLGVKDGVAETEGVIDGVSEGVALALGVDEAEGVLDGVLLRVKEGVLLGVRDGVFDPPVSVSPAAQEARRINP
jgi:hypothetical protein